ncbi:MAG: transcriptional regulator NrdR [Alphaproteobacteria bacterium CG_4_9_14_3_um_filter_47_13]|nr:MAG: transcriptional regulator NrdR [Alphaproteobacteria bacterium CG_4_9_14_3_um_filter_47_13]
MRCPFCSSEDSQVKDSRPTEDNSAIRRRRSCPDCGARFTTFERVQLREMTVLKAGDRRQPFDRDKLIKSMQIALRKRPVELEQIEKSANSIVRQLESMGESEVASEQIGEMVMKALARLDTVAYIRFASVYKDFSKPEDFNDLLEEMEVLQQGQVSAE